MKCALHLKYLRTIKNAIRKNYIHHIKAKIHHIKNYLHGINSKIISILNLLKLTKIRAEQKCFNLSFKTVKTCLLSDFTTFHTTHEPFKLHLTFKNWNYSPRALRLLLKIEIS